MEIRLATGEGEATAWRDISAIVHVMRMDRDTGLRELHGRIVEAIARYRPDLAPFSVEIRGDIPATKED